MNFEVHASYDRSAWDGFVSSLPAGHFMQSYAWGDFQRQLGWEPRYCLLRDGGDIRAAAMVLERAVPLLHRKVFHAPRGPAVDVADRSATDELLMALASHVRQQGGIFLRCDPYWGESEVLARGTALPLMTRVSRDWSYWNAPRFVLWLDLRGDESELMSRMTSRCRNDVRRGYKSGVAFSLGDETGIGEFHRLMVLTGSQKGIAFHGLEYYRRLLAAVSASARVQLFLGRFEGQVITAGVSVAYGTKAWLLYAASDPSHYKLRANRAQQWEMLKWAQAQGCVRYDFRGTATNDPPSPADPGYGVYEFKKSFGPEFIRLAPYYDLVQRPLLYQLLRVAEEYALPAAYRVRTWVQR